MAAEIATRIALVTGAGSGVGRAVAEALAADGWSLALAGRRQDALDATAAALPTPSLAHATDITDPASIAALFAAAVEKFGRLDLLFNNAGTGSPPVHFDEIPLDTWRRVVDTNLTGSFLCAQHAFRQMRAQSPQGGRIINNGSISAYAPRPRSAPYTATKHAISGLTRALALDGREFGITCGQIDIGNAATDMTARMANGVLQPDGTTRVEPTMHVQNVARAVATMAAMPPDANVLFMNVMAAQMPFVGRG